MQPAAQRLRAVLLCASLVACSESARPSVLLITVDTLRADHLGCYGYERETSPELDAFAQRAVLFERAYTQAPFTAPAHASLFTSLHSQSHGVLFWGMSLDPAARTLAERFRAAGYATGAFYNHPGLTEAMGMLRGFETVELGYTGPAATSIDGLLAWIDAQTASGAPFCAWLHLWDVHRPFGWRDWRNLPASAAERARGWPPTLAYEETRFGAGPVEIGRGEQYYNLNREERRAAVGGAARVLGSKDFEYIANRYDGGVWHADRELGRLFDELDERQLFESTVLALTSDHGEALTEREACYFTHDPFLFDEVLHVPLLLHLPGGAHAGTRVKTLARDVDVLPTLLEAVDLPLLKSDQGVSLLPAVRGEPLRGAPVFAQTQSRNAKESARKLAAGESGWLEQRQAIFDGRWKLIADLETGSRSLFDLESDPGELRDLAGDPAAEGELARLAGLLAALQRNLPRAGSRTLEMSAENMADLQQLGYFDSAEAAPRASGNEAGAGASDAAREEQPERP